MAALRPPSRVLRLPETLPDGGLLAGWSLELAHRRQPIGFSFGPDHEGPQTGVLDPILLESEGHLLTIAPTGAGKGVGCIVPALLRHQGPVIVVDPKGENAMITARHRRDRGDQVVVLDPLGITGLTAGAFNPLDLITPEEATGVDDAAALAAALLPAGTERDRFWVSRGRQLLLAAILHVTTDLPRSSATLMQVRRLVNEAAGNPAEVAERLAASRHPEVRLIAQNLLISASETLGGITAFAQDGVDFLRGPLLDAATAHSSFDLDQVTRGAPMAIYIVLPPHMLASHGRYLRIVISSLLALVTRRRARPERPTLFIIDEAAQLGTLDELRSAVTLMRGYGLQTWSFWQDVSQIRNLYPEDWQTMVNNCRVFQAFGAANLAAAREMSDLVGFLTPEAVLDLERGEMLLQIAGDEAVVARLPNYLTDPAFAGMADANPLFAAGRDPLPEPRPIREYLRSPVQPRQAATPHPVDQHIAAQLAKWIAAQPADPDWRGEDGVQAAQ